MKKATLNERNRLAIINPERYKVVDGMLIIETGLIVKDIRNIPLRSVVLNGLHQGPFQQIIGLCNIFIRYGRELIVLENVAYKDRRTYMGLVFEWDRICRKSLALRQQQMLFGTSYLDPEEEYDGYYYTDEDGYYYTDDYADEDGYYEDEDPYYDRYARSGRYSTRR